MKDINKKFMIEAAVAVAVLAAGAFAAIHYNKQGAGQQKTLSLIALPSGDTIKTIDLGEYRAPHDVRWVDATQVVVTV